MISNNPMPTVSIIIPVYNASKYLKECLDSIICNNLSDLEIITVDDGSTDNSLEILNSYRDKFGIKVLTQHNSGPARARNTGLSIANGEYVGFVDADDWVEPMMFSEMYLAAKREKADIVFCNVYRNHNRKMRKYLASGVYDAKGIRQTIYPMLVSRVDESAGKMTIRGCVWLRLFRNEMLRRNSIQFDEKLVYNEDGLFCIDATLAAERYVYLGDSYLYHNRYVEGSLTKRYIANLWDRQRSMIDALNLRNNIADYDFTPQIDKKAMEIAIYCIENICKSDNHKTIRNKLKDIKAIICSEEIKKRVKRVPVRRMKRINKIFWASIILKLPWLSLLAARYRMKKNGTF